MLIALRRQRRWRDGVVVELDNLIAEPVVQLGETDLQLSYFVPPEHARDVRLERAYDRYAARYAKETPTGSAVAA